MVVIMPLLDRPIHPRKACTSHRILYRKRLWRLGGDSAGIDALLCFALVSSGVVLKKDLNKATAHELLVKCVIILTSVVPRPPLQMAFAVNQAILALNKKQSCA